MFLKGQLRRRRWKSLLVICSYQVVLAIGARGQELPHSSGNKTPNKLAFNRSIQPILSENCYPCHGPDPGARKAKLRLDRAEFAYAPHDKSGPAIIPGQPGRSPLVQKIEARNPKDRMPPPEAHKTLKPEQIASLRDWVKQGAVYEEHWSFIVPKSQPLPEVKQNGWAR